MSIRSFDDRQKSRYINMSERLYADYDALKELFPSNGYHNAVNGANNERLLIEYFNDELTNGFKATSGFVVNSEGEMSSQMDIIIYDDSTPLIFDKAGISIVPLDGVRAIIEVKSRMKGFINEDKDCLDKILKKMFDEKNRFMVKNRNLVFSVFSYTLSRKTLDIKELELIFQNNLYQGLKFCININQNTFITSFKINRRSRENIENRNTYLYSHELFQFDEKLAMGYFLDNIRYAISNENKLYLNYLFPNRGKMMSRLSVLNEVEQL